jgi:hypothetical protein
LTRRSDAQGLEPARAQAAPFPRALSISATVSPEWDLLASKWANPFKIVRDGTRDEVIEKYKRGSLSSPI